LKLTFQLHHYHQRLASPSGHMKEEIAREGTRAGRCDIVSG
jgi:hypothetical protein